MKNYTIPNPVLVICVTVVLSVVSALQLNASIILSTDATETLGGLTFRDGDAAEYEPTTDTATLFFNEDFFGANEEIDAMHVLANGNIILSTDRDALLGGLSFGAGDLVEYNPISNTATLLFNGSLFGSNENIDAVHVLGNSNIIFSTADAAMLGALSFNNGDLVEYNPTTGTAALLFSESLFGNDEDIDAVHILDSGNIILSTTGAATLGGLSFSDGSLVEFDPTTNTATLYFNENLFSTNANIDAVYIQTPEPATVALLGFGTLVLIPRNSRRKSK